jgi:hypothetical protein
MSFEPRDFLRHILVEADYLIGRSAGLSFETFLATTRYVGRLCAALRSWRGNVDPARPPVGLLYVSRLSGRITSSVAATECGHRKVHLRGPRIFEVFWLPEKPRRIIVRRRAS